MSIPFRSGTEQHRLLGAAVTELVDIDRQIRRLEARRMAGLARVREIAHQEADAARAEAASEGRRLGYEHDGVVHRAAEAEVAFALGVSDRAVARQIDHADRVMTDYPVTHAALAAGRIALGHTTGIADAGAVIRDAGARRAYEAEALAYAVRESPNRTRRIAKILADKYAATTFEERHQTARERRLISVTPVDDGMAELKAIMDASSAHAIYDRLCQQARLVQDAERASAAEAKRAATRDTGVDVPGVRPLDHIRADLAADILLHGAPSNDLGEIDLSSIRARVQVTVPVLSLLPATRAVSEAGDNDPGAHGGDGERGGVGACGDADERGDAGARGGDGERGDAASERHYLRVAGLQGAAVLAGYGPIDAATARLLAGLSAGWDRISCHPITGGVLGVDRYRPSAQVRRFVIARDTQCRFPGCTVVAHRADLDHTVDAAQGGATSTKNLAVLCRRHHVLKHRTGMTVAQSPGGALEWTSSLRRRLRDTPVSRVMFRAVREAPEAGATPGSRRSGTGGREPTGNAARPRTTVEPRGPAPPRREPAPPPF
ncbi:DUF222 domain-containing protein [Leucobacter sp. CSA1]|uniref:DUF222 domain-containing protein n=1 Tax=Leucobacter chromiisoli TaxID=2796471 RepID=A0A934USS1_9MICO|nr:HNH endonuclease signature motif containing protein [Leucobacter chromiisoli]MBK0417604.1 DUF222 domain-containing protein [Leucobacter chromiisoli]